MNATQTKETQMDRETLRKKAAEYDRINNEGGEGYNPYRDQLADLDAQIEAARPKSIGERRYALQRRLTTVDCSVARESGTYNQAEVDAIRANLAALDAEEKAEVEAAGWTLEVTKTRRADWNSRRVTMSTIVATQAEVGYTLQDLKAAIAAHKL